MKPFDQGPPDTDPLRQRNTRANNLHRQNALIREGVIWLRCDNLGCNEMYPLEHEDLGTPGFGTGRWLGWLYLDMNREDLFERDFRFCSTWCVIDWLPMQQASKAKRPVSVLDKALRQPGNEVVRRAVLGGDWDRPASGSSAEPTGGES